MTTQTDVSALLNAISLGKLNFQDVLSFIHDHYHYTPVAFDNGELHNAAGENEGSAKIFAFAKLHGLNQIDTLALFAEHYQAVLANPEGNDHANIRNFMHYGWLALNMPTPALQER
ncbi:MAG: HopJ type III effector protein [Moraxella sp.]|nr:HopJ type III effector protein [Moraxella sp.]